MRSYPRSVESSNSGCCNTTNNGNSNDGACSQQSLPPGSQAIVKLRPPIDFYRGDPEAMDDVNLLNTNPSKCFDLFGVRDPKFDRKIYFFETLDSIRILRNPALEIDVMQYEYNGGTVCFLVGEKGSKEELIRKGFVFLHECFLGSPIKAFIDLDFPPSNVSASDFRVMLTRAQNWITRFRCKVNDTLEGIMLSIKREEKAKKAAANPKKRAKKIGAKGLEKERKKFTHEWSIQTANRLPGGGGTSKISFHVVNNSLYDGKPILFADIVSVDKFVKNILYKLDAPNGFKVDGTFTYKGKTLRCLGGAKRSEPSRIFVEVGNPKKPFDFGCVQPDVLGEHYLVSMAMPSTMFDDLYPESDFLPGHGGGNRGGGGGGAQQSTGSSTYSCKTKLPKTVENTEICNDLIFRVAQYLSSVEGYSHLADVVKRAESYTFYNHKTNHFRNRVDIGISTAPHTYCLFGPREHNDGKGNTALQLRVERGVDRGDFHLVLKCSGDISPDHPIKELDVGRLGGGSLDAKSGMIVAADIVACTFFGGGTAQQEHSEVFEDVFGEALGMVLGS